MLILTLRTDKPEAEIGLYTVHNSDTKVGVPAETSELAYKTWEAHRQLAETIHEKLKAMLEAAGKSWSDIQGIVIYRGPGSFTGLRIGLSVANALAYSQSLPIVGSTGNDWVETGLIRISSGETDNVVLPEYGSPVHITMPKK